MRILIVGLLLAALTLAGGLTAVGAPERTRVPVIELLGQTSESTTTRPRWVGGSGAIPVPSPAPMPVGCDDVDDVYQDE